MIQLFSPIWLLLIIPFVIAMLRWRLPSRLLLVLRVGALAMLLLAMSGLAIKLQSRKGIVIAVVDRSASMPTESLTENIESIRIMQKGKTGGDKLAVVSYGVDASIERIADDGDVTRLESIIDPHGSNLHDAIERAMALVPADTPARVVVFSDGRWTGKDPMLAVSRAAARGIAIDFRHSERAEAGDLAIAAVEAPSVVNPKEAYLITAWVRSPVEQTVNYTLRRGKTVIAKGKQGFTAGINRLSFRDRVADPSTVDYGLSVEANRKEGESPTEDPIAENNSARMLVRVQGPRPVLMVTNKPNSNFHRLLRQGGLNLAIRSPDQVEYSLAGLSNYSAVVLEETPSASIGRAGMLNLAQWVRHTGAGLMMTGGPTSFGTGGYYKSPIEKILPVSLELRKEHRKFKLAIVVAMDRSGSMMAPTPSGKTKMDLANVAAAEVLNMLSAQDEFGVLAVDTAAHVIAPLTLLSDEEANGRLRSRILSIASQGGGIFVYEALSKAVQMLANADSGNRHIILFSDAADSEQPGAYKQLLENARKNGITCSVIALGTNKDSDAALLEDIAKRGGGRVFFTQNAEELPRLFAQDTFVVARSSFVEERTPVLTTAGLTTLLGRQLDVEPATVNGYNLTYLKETANAAAITNDADHKAPVIASWSVGLGRTLAYTAQADGKFTGDWQNVGDLYTSLVRWTAGDRQSLPDNMMLTQELTDDIVRVTLHLDPLRKVKTLSVTPSVMILRGKVQNRFGQAPRAEELNMRWSSPDTLSTEFKLRGNETAIATASLGSGRTYSLPAVTLPYSPEYRPTSSLRGHVTLNRMAQATGGIDRIDLPAVFKGLPRRPRIIELAPALFLIAMGLLLLEVLERRTGALSMIRLPRFGKRKATSVSEQNEEEDVPESQVRRPKRKSPASGSGVTSPDLKTTRTPKPKSAAAMQDEMFDALSRARKRARDRTTRD